MSSHMAQTLFINLSTTYTELLPIDVPTTFSQLLMAAQACLQRGLPLSQTTSLSPIPQPRLCTARTTTTMGMSYTKSFACYSKVRSHGRGRDNSIQNVWRDLDVLAFDVVKRFLRDVVHFIRQVPQMIMKIDFEQVRQSLYSAAQQCKSDKRVYAITLLNNRYIRDPIDH